MARIGFWICALAALFGFCAGWGWGFVLVAILWAAACWQMDQEMNGRGMR